MKPGTPEERAKRRAEEYIGLLWHVASYLIVVPFLFVLDWYVGSGIDWAFWVAVPWAVGLLFHLFAYATSTRLMDRTYARFLEQEKAKAKKA